MRASRGTWPRLAALIVAVAASSLSLPAAAQQPALPQASPKASVSQQVGLTEFAVSWSSPAVRGRTVFGELVPFGEVWRTGANAATTLTASRDFYLGETKVPAGTYALFTIPNRERWTVILNTDHQQWGSFQYDASKDVARIDVEVEPLERPRERLTFVFADTTHDRTFLEIQWDRTGVRVPLGTDTAAHVAAEIDQAIEKSWMPHYQSARWLLENDGDLDRALRYVETSIAIRPTWWNQWVKAQILAKKGRKKDAIKAAKAAQDLGKGDRIYEGFYVQTIEAAIRGWK